MEHLLYFEIKPIMYNDQMKNKKHNTFRTIPIAKSYRKVIETNTKSILLHINILYLISSIIKN
jgi:hypothetical protein